MFTLTRKYKIKLRQLATTAAIVLALAVGCQIGQRFPDAGAPAPTPVPASPTTSAVHTTSVGR